jgi:psp operon transcriptional activator
MKPTFEAIGQADIILKVQERISRVAKINRPVLIIGERGTGKELAASRLHYLSERWQNPFITLNCASLNPSVLESELFGHEAGAFTGAQRQRKGRFEMAEEGTLFLDEIGTMPMIVQEKILRAIEYRTFERVGGSVPVSVDVRIIAATNADLPALVQDGRFKADLLDRLSFEVIFVPPLRERKEDIPLLARHFAAQMSIELGFASAPEFSDTTMEQLLAYHWPGNIRELKNVVERAVYQSTSGIISGVKLNPFEGALPASPVYSEKVTQMTGDNSSAVSPSEDNHLEALPLAMPLTSVLNAMERCYLDKALEQARYNQKKAAELLNISYHQIRALYRKHISQPKE